MTSPPVKVDHAKMQAVVNRIDRLLETLGSAGNAGSYASLGEAGKVAQAVCTVAEPEMAEFVRQYNTGFGSAARQYQQLCTSLVKIRDAVAQTANIHLDNDEIQAKAFKPLEDDGLSVNGGVTIAGHHFGSYHSNETTGTTAAGNQASSNPSTVSSTGDSGGGDSGGGDSGAGSTTVEAPGPVGSTQHPSTTGTQV